MTALGNYDYWFTSSDDRPTIRAAFEASEPNDDQVSSDVDVTGATFSMTNMSTGSIIVDAATGRITGAGVVEYQLESSDTSDPGDYRGHFTLTLDDGSTRTVPQTEPIAIKVTK